MDIPTRAAELSTRDRSEGWALILLGVPFAIASYTVMSLLLFALLWFVGVPAAVALGIGAALTLVAMVIDTLQHPEEQWKVARYRLSDGSTSGPSMNTVWLAALGLGPAAFSGMPLTANVSDPENLAEHGGMMTSGCATVVLGGPRQVRRGLSRLALARLRTDSRVLGEAGALLTWVRATGPVEQGLLAAEAARQRWLGGLALVMELGALRWALEDGVKRAVVREE